MVVIVHEDDGTDSSYYYINGRDQDGILVGNTVVARFVDPDIKRTRILYINREKGLA